MIEHSGERGSAYLITLLVLIVLTMLALGLSFATQTELLVGSNERVLQRAFYTAESGIHLAVARSLRKREKCAFFHEDEGEMPRGAPGSKLKSWIQYDAVYPVNAPWCNLCSATDADHYSSNAFFKVDYQITARGVLFSGSTIGARKTVTSTIDVHPWQDNREPRDCGGADLALEREKRRFKR